MTSRWLAAVCIIAAVMLPGTLTAIQDQASAGGAPAGAQKSEPERYTALAVNMGSMNGGRAALTVEIVIERWSTAAEQNRLMNVLQEQGSDQLLKVLQNMPRLGSISTPASVGFDLRYASRQRTASGSERIMLMTDRPLGFWESIMPGRSVDYPFTVIELNVGPDGTGQGTMAYAAKLAYDANTKTIDLENLGIQPVTLNSVRREK